jgi:multicomponent Na+:H+ antiporter subunit B
MIRPKESVIVQVVTRTMVPLIQIFALYVVFHGHYSPGGGFQGGALLAASVLLQRVVLGRESSQPGFASFLDTPMGIVGALIFAGCGVVALVFGGRYLQYDQLPFGMTDDMLRNTGILIVEIGVAFAVMGTLVSIFDDLLGSEDEL